MMTRLKSKVLLILSLALCFAFCIAAAVNSASASKFMGEIMHEEFLTEDFSTDNWRLAEGDENASAEIYTVPGEPYLLLYGPSYDAGTAVYIDAAAEVAEDTGKLIVEFDLMNEESFSSMFSVVTGMKKNDDGNIVFDDEKRSQMIMTGPGKPYACVVKALPPGQLGKPTAFNLYYNDTNYGGATPSGGYGRIGYRYRLVYGQDGSFYSYASPILSDGTYGAEEAGVYVPEGMMQNELSGCVGFFFWFEQIGIHLQNVKISTQATEDADAVTVFEDLCENETLKSEWKTINGNARVSMARSEGKAFFENPSDVNYLVSAGSKNIAYDAMYDAYITMDFTLTLNELNGVRQFGVAFGLTTSEDNTQTEGVAYFSFRRNAEDDTKIDMFWTIKGAEADLQSNVVSLNASDVIGKTLDITLSPYVNGKVDVVIGDDTHTFEIAGEKIILDKRFAFIAYGGDPSAADTVRAVIGPVTITNTYDSIPDDIVDISAGFGGVDEDGNPWYDSDLISFAGTLGYAYGDLNAGVFIEDGQLVFRNAGHNSYFNPLKAFGDFLMQFEITDMQREDEFTQDGALYRPFMRSWLGITFGLPSAGSPYTSGYLLYITPTYEEDAENPGTYKPSDSATAPSPFVLLGPNEVPILSGTLRHNLTDPALDGHSIVVRLKADGGVLTFSYYVKGEESMDMLDVPVFTYDNNGLGFSHNGYFGITCTSGGTDENPICGDFAIDNFVIKSLERNIDINNDPDKPVEETPAPPTDPDPDPSGEEETGCGSAVLGTAGLAGLVASGAAAVLCLKNRRRTKKE